MFPCPEHLINTLPPGTLPTTSPVCLTDRMNEQIWSLNRGMWGTLCNPKGLLEDFIIHILICWNDTVVSADHSDIVFSWMRSEIHFIYASERRTVRYPFEDSIHQLMENRTLCPNYINMVQSSRSVVVQGTKHENNLIFQKRCCCRINSLASKTFRGLYISFVFFSILT